MSTGVASGNWANNNFNLVARFMSTEVKPKELSSGFVLRVHELPEGVAGDAKNNTRLSGCVQVLDINLEQTYKVVISDGHSFVEVILLKTAHQKMTEANKMFKKLDIIMVTIMRHKAYLVIQDPTVVYQNVSKIIGDPVPVADYLRNGKVNAKGDCRIPAELWSLPAERNTAGQFSELEEEDDEANPIAMLTIGSTNWQIKAKVESKGPIRSFERKTGGPGQGKVTSITIYDHSAKILATMWSEAIDKYYDMLEIGQVYLFSGGEVKRRGNFNTTNNEVELNFGAKMMCVKATSNKIPVSSFEFVPLNVLFDKPMDSYWDLAGIVRDIGKMEPKTTKKGEDTFRMSLFISDDTNTQLEMTVWGSLCETISKLQQGDIIILTQVRLSEYNGNKQLNTSSSTQLVTKLPDHKRVKDLFIWKNQHDKAGGLPAATVVGSKGASEPREIVYFSHSSYRKWCEDNHDMVISNSGTQQRLPVFNLLGYLAHLPTSSQPGERMTTYYYDRCSNDNCFKKATQDPMNPTSWTCPNCGPLKAPAIPKFIGTVKTRDSSGVLYPKISTDLVGKELYGKTAAEIKNQELIQDREEFLRYMHSREGMLLAINVVPQADSYQGEHRVTSKIISCMVRTPKNVNTMTKALIHTINLLTKGELN